MRLQKYLGQLGKISRDLQSMGMQLRMIPLRGVFQKMARLVRDLSKKSHKQVRLESSGESTEMDRSMVEQITDPLVHMIRNAVDHAIERLQIVTSSGRRDRSKNRLMQLHHAQHLACLQAQQVDVAGRRAIDQPTIDGAWR